jgi:hypothetical protein
MSHEFGNGIRSGDLRILPRFRILWYNVISFEPNHYVRLRFYWRFIKNIDSFIILKTTRDTTDINY